MKIMLISNIFPPGYIGGYELAAKELCDYLHLQGHTVKVITSNYFDTGSTYPFKVDRKLDCVGINHIRPAGREAAIRINIINYNNIRIIAAEVRDMAPDIIIAFNLAGLGPVALFDYISHLSTPSLFYFMDTPFAGLASINFEFQKAKKMLDFGIRPASCKSIFMSDLVRQEIYQFIDASLTDIIVPGWVEGCNRTTECAGASRKPFVFCSRLTNHKGADLVVQAAKIIKSEGYQFSIDMYGAGDVSSIMQMTKSYNVDDIVTYKGNLRKDQVVDVLSEYRALLFPTASREPFGFIVAESAMAGCIPIFTSGIGASEWFIDQIDCIKISRDLDSLVKAMKDMLEISQDKVEVMSANAVAAAKAFLEMDFWMTELERVICSHAIQFAERSKKDALISSSYLYFHDMMEH